MDGIDRHKPLTLILPRYTGQEGSINRLICKAKKSKNLLCLSLSYEPVIEQEFDWIETRGAYTSKVSLAQQFLETKAKVLFRSQGVHYLLLLAIPMPMPMIERLGEYTDREERDRKHKVASEASGESNERVRIGPITLTQGESIAWFPTGRKGLGLDERAVFGTICTVAGKAGVKLFTSSGYEPYLASKANPFTSEILPNSNYKERKG
ncbi:hypothetical protein GmHk_U059877 (mitochondrion) [Glycine max]|nr:hypothetical protein GmHk_U059877 [Glycine max]